MVSKIWILLLLSATVSAGQSFPASRGAGDVACPPSGAPVPDSLAGQCPPSPASNMGPGTAQGVSGMTLTPPGVTATLPEAMPAGRTTEPAIPTSRRAGPITVRSEFEQLAEDSAGRPMPVYGRQLFDQVPTTFAPISEAPVPSDYVIGPGDELIIRIWGKVDLDTRVTVDRNGQFFLPRVGTLSVAGLRSDQLQSYIHAAVGNLYKDFNLDVTMGRLRSIQIFVLGSARQPGVYTVSSLSTLVDALFASGGPSATGSMRHIELRRGGSVVTAFDIYALLRNGDKSHDVRLLPGDVIYIPPVGPQVAVMGAVNEPGIYELDGGTTIAAALKDSGGLTNLASTERVLLERVQDNRRRRVDDFALDDSALKRELRDGDMLRIFPISPQFENAVTLRGNVAQPGRYPWHPGMRISDLIPSRDFLITRDYWIGQNHLTPSSDTNPGWNPQFNQYNAAGGRNSWTPQNGPMDRQSLSGQRELPGDLDGVAQARASYGRQQSAAYDSRLTDDDRAAYDNRLQISPTDSVPPDMMSDIAQNNSEINWEYAAIERLDENDLSTRLIAFNLGKALDNHASADNQMLRSGDVVTIFARRDLPLPMEKHATFVRIDGEVNAPGVYRVHPGETLREVVQRAGGLTPHSYLYASQLTRLSARRAEELQLRQSAVEMQRELASRYAAAPTLNSASATEEQAQLSSQQALVAQLAAVHPTGRVVLDMKPDAATVGDIPALPLEDGDSFYIPPKLSTVQVAGAVYNPNAFRYQSRKRLAAYLSDAGGPTRQADRRRIFLIRADGTVVSSQNHGQYWHSSFDRTTLLPGDAIIVPNRLKAPGSFMQQLPFVSQIISQTALTGAVIGTTY